MADNPIDPKAANDMDVDDDADIPAPAIGIESQYIKDLSFENPLGATAATAVQLNPEVEVEVTTSARSLSSDGRYEVALVVRGQAKTPESTVFIAELTYAGVVVLTNVPEDAIKPVLFIEGARLLFPFARNIIADVTRDGGFPPLFINPIDFVQLYQEQHMTEGDTLDIGADEA